MNNLKITRFPELNYACNEAMNTLCTNLSYCGVDVKVVLVTSRYEEEGKSSVTFNMMRTLASYGKRVLLVDADLRRSVMARRYRIDFLGAEVSGLSQYLAGMSELSDVVFETNIANAFILPAGREVMNSIQLLSSPRLGAMIKELRSEFDIVLIDTPPAGVIVDAVEIARHCDGALIVVGYNKGRGQDIANVVADISKTGCKVLGAVMNGVNLSSFTNRKYYYSSGRYNAYYSNYYQVNDGDKAKVSGKSKKK